MSGPCRHSLEFVFVVTETQGGWSVEGDRRPLGFFDSREQALHLALGMAKVLRTVGQRTAVWVQSPGFKPR